MMTRNFLKNIEKYLKKDLKNRKIIFEYNNKIILSDTYSIIILYKNNLKIRDDEKINDLIKKYDVKKYDDLDYLVKYGNVYAILNYYKMLQDTNFLETVEIKTENKAKYQFLNSKNNNDYSIDIKYLNNINKIINNKSNIIYNNLTSDFINSNGNLGRTYILKMSISK